MVAIDSTHHFIEIRMCPLEHKLQQQADEFSALSQIHDDNPPSSTYWGQRYFSNFLKDVTGVSSSWEFQYQWLERVCVQNSGRTIRVVSIGAGECTEEIAVAIHALGKFKNFRIECVDVAGRAIERAAQRAADHGVADRFRFTVGTYEEVISQPADIVIVNQALHHFVDLESLFDNIQKSIGDHGIFLTNDMIGRNGHMLWPEALAIVDRFWEKLPAKYKQNHCLGRHEEIYGNWDNSREMNEGIRSQDILPELIKRFKFRDFIAGRNIAFTIFGRHFGQNFDPDNEVDRAMIDQISRLDYDLIDIGYLKPVLMVAAMANTFGPTRIHRHWTPEFCVRQVDPLEHIMRRHRFDVGESIEISERKPGASCLGDGWSSPEQGGVWSNAERSTLSIPLAATLSSGKLFLTIAGMQYRPPGVEVGSILVNRLGREIASLTLAGLDDGLQAHTIEIYIEEPVDSLEIELVYDTPIVPARYGISIEQRMLALRLAGLQLSGFTPL